jgi:hypothetical protein
MTSSYLDRPLRSLAQVQATRLTRKAISLSIGAENAGNDARARHMWRRAVWLSYRCGGVSGEVRTERGDSGIVIDDGGPGHVVWSLVRAEGALP